MASLLKQQHDLAVLQLALDRSDPELALRGGEAVFTVEVTGDVVFEERCDSAALGLSQTIRELRRSEQREPEYQIPEYVVLGIRDALGDSLSSGAPLWLQFGSHCGNLPLLPWEQLLTPVLETPILRLPYYTLKPFSSAASCLDIVICATSPEPEWSFPVEAVLDTLTRRIFEVVQRPTMVVHLFSDSRVYPLLERLIYGDRRASAGGTGVRLYDPSGVESNQEETVSSSTTAPAFLENPWLRWISAALGGRSADVVHFLGNGYLSSEQGHFVFADSPVANPRLGLVRYASAQQLTAFAQHLGAWSLGFSFSHQGVSNQGLRLLVDQIARQRPGPALLHQLSLDQQLDAAAEMYRFLYNAEQDVLPKLPAVAMYCHPARVRELSMSRGLLDTEASELREYTLAQDKSLDVLSASQNTPAWVASSQRYLEQSAAQLFNEPAYASATDSAREGEQEALRLVAEVMRRHVGQAETGAEAGGAHDESEGAA